MNRLISIGLFLLIFTNAWNCHAQNSEFSRQGFFDLRIVDGKLESERAGEFLAECRKANYVLFGEQHGVDGVAQFVAATQRSLEADGFSFFIRESGDWFGAQLSQHPPLEVLQRYPHSLAFDYNEDVELLQQTVELFGSAPNRIIGVDQEITLIHPLYDLSQNSINRDARRIARGLFLKAVFQAGRYVKKDFSADLVHLREAVKGDSASESTVESMLKSMSIYVDHIQGNRVKSVADREQFMKDLFDKARTAVPPDAKFIAKMGGLHLLKGKAPGLSFESFGSHVNSVAENQGQRTFHIGIRAWTPENVLPMPEELRQHRFVFLKSDIFREHLSKSGQLTDEIALRLNRYDAFILLPNATQASNSTVRTYEQQFVRGLLLKLAAIVPCLLLLAFPIGYWKLGWLKRLIQKGKSSEKQNLGQHVDVVLVSSVMIILLAYQIFLLLKYPLSATPSSSWVVWLTDGLMFCGILLLVFNAFAKKLRHLGVWFRIRQLAGVSACVGILLFITYWNLNGMLGF